MKKEILICLIMFCFIEASGQYHQSISDASLKSALIKGLSIEGIAEDTITIRKNFASLTSGMDLKLGDYPNKPFMIRYLREKDLFDHLIDNYIEFGNVSVSQNYIILNYIKRSEQMIVHLILRKKMNGEWVIIDKEIIREGSLLFNDFLYDSIRREKNKKE